MKSPAPTRRTAATALLGALGIALVPGLAPAADPFFVDISDVPPTAEGDLLDVAAAVGQFQTFIAAVRAAGYEDTLRGQGPFTVFAPTDTAFRAMNTRDLHRLMQPQAHQELRSLIAYHITLGAPLTSARLHSTMVRRMASDGHELNVDGRDGLRVNDELVVLPDIEARNGVIQGINAVLAPPVVVAAS